jgi:hypothetical protein
MTWAGLGVADVMEILAMFWAVHCLGCPWTPLGMGCAKRGLVADGAGCGYA